MLMEVPTAKDPSVIKLGKELKVLDVVVPER